MYQLIYTGMKKKQGVFRFFSKKGLSKGLSTKSKPQVFPTKLVQQTCTGWGKTRF
jgi:hypothetical protein